MVEDRHDDIASVGQGSADLDLAVVPLEAAAQLEDSPGPRRAADGQSRKLAQLTVGLLGALAPRLDAGDEEAGHLRRASGLTDRKCLRISGVIGTIVSGRFSTHTWISSSVE